MSRAEDSLIARDYQINCPNCGQIIHIPIIKDIEAKTKEECEEEFWEGLAEVLGEQ